MVTLETLEVLSVPGEHLLKYVLCLEDPDFQSIRQNLGCWGP